MLGVRGLTVRYDRLEALSDASIKVDRGELVCVVGPNGAGKSTLLKAIAGGVKVAHGSIDLLGKPIANVRAEVIARSSVSLVPEGRHIFPDLTVDENLRIGTFMRRDKAAVGDEIVQVLDVFPRLKARHKQLAGRLSGGEQQMLVIGRAILTGAQLILIDEPSLGLAPRLVSQVYETLLDLRKRRGLTLLINEQNSNRVLRYADRIYVLRGGRVRLEGTPSELQSGDAIRAAYFGFESERGAAGRRQ